MAHATVSRTKCAPLLRAPPIGTWLCPTDCRDPLLKCREGDRIRVTVVPRDPPESLDDGIGHEGLSRSSRAIVRRPGCQNTISVATKLCQILCQGRSPMRSSSFI